MSFKGVDHVVLRVADLDAAIANYNKILGIDPKRAHSEVLQADQAFYYFEKFQLKQFKVRTVLMTFLQEDSKLRPPNNPGSQFPGFP